MAATPDFILMRRELGAPLPQPAWPAGIRLAAPDAADAPAIHALLQHAYATGFGAVPHDWPAWWGAMVGDSEYAPELCLVAKAAEGVAGFCLCWTSSFIKDIAVAPDWQRRGLARALLLTAMARLQARGETGVSLKVRLGNAVALRMYEGMGFAR